MYLPNHYIKVPTPELSTTNERAKAYLSPSRCPQDCAECRQQFRNLADLHIGQLTYKDSVTDIQALEIIQNLVTNITKDREYLTEQCNAYGNTIWNRWIKKSRDKREAMLFAADPKMCKQEWCEPRFQYEVDKGASGYDYSVHARKFRHASMLPYLNIDGLKADPAQILGILYNRVKYTPGDWAPYDNQQLKQCWECGGFEILYNPRCVIMQGSKFGELTSWYRNEAHRWDTVGFPRAQLILEAQAHIFKVLRGLVEQLVDGLQSSTPVLGNNWTQLAEIGFKQASTVDFASVYINQPYSAPPIFEIQKLISVVQARLSANEDHVWLLQTDCAYLRRWLTITEEILHYKDDLGFKISDKDITDIVTIEVLHEVWTFRKWASIWAEVKKLEVIHSTCKDNIAVGHPLPEEYDKALGGLEVLVAFHMEVLSRHIQLLLPQRPGFRKIYKFDYSRSGQVNMTLIDHAPLCDKFFDDRLDWAVNNLLGDPDAEMRMQMATVFRILNQHLADATKEERARLDEPLYNKFSEYAAFHEILSMLRLHRPRTTRRDLEEVRNSGNCRAWKFSPSESARMQMAEQMSADPAIKDKALRLARVVKSMRTSLENIKASSLPSGTRDQVWIDKDREIRKHMTAFWGRIREYGTISKTAKSLSQKEVEEETVALSADLSAEHLATINSGYAKVLAGLKTKTATSSTRTKTLVLGDIQTEWGTTDTSKVTPLATKSKNKTRPDKNGIDGGVSSLSIFNQGTFSTTNDDTQLEEKVSIKKRTLDIFDMMFPVGDPSQKSVDWPDFVQVMAEVGVVAHHSGGSAVLFEPNEKSKWVGKGMIVIHRPHPDSKIHPVMLLSIGKRMGKWFGWSRECFQLEMKQG